MRHGNINNVTTWRGESIEGQTKEQCEENDEPPSRKPTYVCAQKYLK
jgi:hypothetical protein